MQRREAIAAPSDRCNRTYHQHIGIPESFDTPEQTCNRISKDICPNLRAEANNILRRLVADERHPAVGGNTIFFPRTVHITTAAPCRCSVIGSIVMSTTFIEKLSDHCIPLLK